MVKEKIFTGKTEVKIAKEGNKSSDFSIKKIGNPTIKSPLSELKNLDLKDSFYVNNERDMVIFDLKVNAKNLPAIKSFDRAEPRSKIFFDSDEVKAGIVTCGWICHGLNNDVIRSVVLKLEQWL